MRRALDQRQLTHLRWIVAGLLLVGGGMLGGLITHAAGRRAPARATVSVVAETEQALDPDRLDRMGVRFAPVESGGQRAVDVVGVLGLERSRVAAVSSHAPGRIAALPAQLGQHVHAGETLARIESPVIGEAAANFRVHTAELRSAQQNLARLQSLRQQGLTTQREIEVAEAAVRTGEANQYADRTRLRAYGVGPEHFAGSAPMVSPIDGEIIRRDVVLGSWLEPEHEAFLVADLSSLWAELDVPESELGSISIGSTASIDVPALSEPDAHGTVQHIFAEVDGATRMGKVRVAVPNTTGRLRAGLSVTAHIHVSARGNALRVPTESVRRCAAGECVLLRRGEHVSWAPVTVGMRSTDSVEIAQGLSAGDSVAVSGVGLLADN